MSKIRLTLVAFGLFIMPFLLPAQVSWTNLIGVTATSGSLCKSVSTSWGNAGGFSVESIPAISNGYAQYTMDNGGEKSFGLSYTDSDQNYTSIDYAFVFTGGLVDIYEAGTWVGNFGVHNRFDVYKVDCFAGNVTYYINNVPVHYSAVTITGELFLDFSIRDTSECMDFEILMSTPWFPYCQLLRTPDAGSYRTFGFILRIEYNEEYILDASSKLQYNVYDKTHAKVASVSESGSAFPSSSPNVTISYYQNYLSLDFTALSLIIGEVYLLEVVNRKNEKRYLKFICENELPN